MTNDADEHQLAAVESEISRRLGVQPPELRGRVLAAARRAVAAEVAGRIAGVGFLAVAALAVLNLSLAGAILRDGMPPVPRGGVGVPEESASLLRELGREVGPTQIQRAAAQMAYAGRISARPAMLSGRAATGRLLLPTEH